MEKREYEKYVKSRVGGDIKYTLFDKKKYRDMDNTQDYEGCWSPDLKDLRSQINARHMKEKKAKMQEEMMEKIAQMGEEAPELPKEMRSEMTSRSNSFDSQDLWDPYNEEEQIGVE